MHHVFAVLDHRRYLICSALDVHHADSMRQLYEVYCKKAEFDVTSRQIGRIELASYYTCQEFIRAYRAKYYLADIIGA